MPIDIDAVLARSRQRVLARLPEDAPGRDGDAESDQLVCVFCDRPLVVRRTILGTLPAPGDGRDPPAIDGVQLKCAGDDGCGFRPDFDVPLVKGHGYWPALTHTEEFQREFDRRDRQRIVDHGYTPGDDDTGGIQDRLEALGYLPETETETETETPPE